MKTLILLLGLCVATWAQQQQPLSHFQVQTHQNRQSFSQRQQARPQVQQQRLSQGQQQQQRVSQGVQPQRVIQGQQPQRVIQGQQQRIPQTQQQGFSQSQQQQRFPPRQQQGGQIQGFGQNQFQQSRPRPTTTTTTTTTARPTPNTSGPRLLSLPELELCQSRPKQWQHGGRNYYFSWDQEEALGVPATERGKKVDWLEARNQCRLRCMDAVSLETEGEAKMVREFIKSRNISYIWTSGRLCDFKGCETREDLKPLSVLGWFWSNTNTKMAATNKIPPGWGFQPWSQKGHTGGPQPDNAEFDINGTPESCLGVLNNIYQDGVVWHDIGCYHKKPYICEDSDLLIRFIEGTHKVKL